MRTQVRAMNGAASTAQALDQALRRADRSAATVRVYSKIQPCHCVALALSMIARLAQSLTAEPQ